MTSEGDSPAPVRPAPNVAENLTPASPDLMTDAELLEQLLLAANPNVVSGEGIKDVGPVRVMHGCSTLYTDSVKQQSLTI